MKSNIINYLKNLGVRGVINWVLFILLIVVAIMRCSDKQEYKKKIDEMAKQQPLPKTELVKEAERISDRVDKEGREIVIWKESEPIIRKIEDSAKVDSIAKIADVRAEKIRSIEKITASLSAENVALKETIRELANGTKDTVWEYKDKWITNTVFLRDTGVFSNIWVDASVSKVEHDRKKYWLFGRNESLSTIWYDSPYIRQSGFESLRIKQKDPLFDFNIKVEGRYLHTPQEVLIGPKIHFSIGRFGISGGYMLNPSGTIGNTAWYGADYKVY